MMFGPNDNREHRPAARRGGKRLVHGVSSGIPFIAFLAGGLMAWSNAHAQSNQVQILCDARIERVGDNLDIYGYVQTDQPATVDYTMTVTTIAAANIGSTTQSGTISLNPNETKRTSQVTVNVRKGGYYEAELSAKERLTGNSCTSKATSQG
jgi:hypothetical protein